MRRVTILMQSCRNSLLLIPVIVVMAGCSVNLQAQEETDLPEELGTALGLYKINGPKAIAKEFENFDFFRLKKFAGQDVDNPKLNSDGKVMVDGWLQMKDGKIFKFRQATVKRLSSGEYEDVEFKTVSVGGTWFTFKGRFLKRKILEKDGFGYTSIQGVLNRVNKGKKIVSIELPFYEHAEL